VAGGVDYEGSRITFLFMVHASRFDYNKAATRRVLITDEVTTMPDTMQAGGERDGRPPRGFPAGEYEARLERAQRLMQKEELAALLLTTEPEVRYFSGFLTQFWRSPTRPWFLVVPRTGKPLAVIPEIGAATMAPDVDRGDPDLALAGAPG